MINWIELTEESMRKNFKLYPDAHIDYSVYIELDDFVFLKKDMIILPSPETYLGLDKISKLKELDNVFGRYKKSTFYPTHFALRSEYEAILPKETK